MSWKPELRVGLVSLFAIWTAMGLEKAQFMDFLFSRWWAPIIASIIGIILVEKYLKTS